MMLSTTLLIPAILYFLLLLPTSPLAEDSQFHVRPNVPETVTIQEVHFPTSFLVIAVLIHLLGRVHL